MLVTTSVVCSYHTLAVFHVVFAVAIPLRYLLLRRDFSRYTFEASRTRSTLILICPSPYLFQDSESPPALSFVLFFFAFYVLVSYSNFQCAHTPALLPRCTSPATFLLQDRFVLRNPHSVFFMPHLCCFRASFHELMHSFISPWQTSLNLKINFSSHSHANSSSFLSIIQPTISF